LKVRNGPGYVDFRAPVPTASRGTHSFSRAPSPTEGQRYSDAGQTITLTVAYSSTGFPDVLRRIRFKTGEGKTLVFLTNKFAPPAPTITEPYPCRWQVELLFKWIKQHLWIKSFLGGVTPSKTCRHPIIGPSSTSVTHDRTRLRI
jgi:hypothetical protein